VSANNLTQKIISTPNKDSFKNNLSNSKKVNSSNPTNSITKSGNERIKSPANLVIKDKSI
jgi:hypothetical protein